MTKATITSVLILCLGLGLGGQGQAADETSRVFAAYKDEVVQIQLIDVASGSKASIGSGFRVSADGLLVTNFHVVSALIYNPERYFAEFVSENGDRGNVELRAIDVVHDLALLKADAPSDAFLELADTAPNKGERLYAFGNPHDIGLTIVEGTYNGLREKSMYDKIHFTASINPGMSGGPTINRSGAVVGVNVSTAGNQLSFLVPVKYVAELVRQRTAPATSAPDFTALATTQLLDNQASYVDRLLGLPVVFTNMSQFQALGRIADFLNCWGDTQREDDALYEWAYQSCSTSDDLFLSDHQTSGVISFTHELFSTEELDRLRFFGFLQDRFQVFRPTTESDEEMVTNFDCETDFVKHGATTTKVVFCLRAYKKFDGLFDAYLKASVLATPSEALQSTLSLAGVSFDNAMRVSKRFLESIQWTK